MSCMVEYCWMLVVLVVDGTVPCSACAERELLISIHLQVREILSAAGLDSKRSFARELSSAITVTTNRKSCVRGLHNLPHHFKGVRSRTGVLCRVSAHLCVGPRLSVTCALAYSLFACVSLIASELPAHCYMSWMFSFS